MFSRNLTFDLRAALALVAVAFCAVSLSGCGGAASIGGEASTYSSPASLGGTVHGGQLPVAFATVKLYAAGTTGYGVGSSLLATTTTGSPTGSFNFTKSATNGSSSVTGTTWACPATTADPVIYLISQGGNSQGTGLNDAGDTNSAIALMYVLGPCSQITNNEYLIVDEVSTTSAVFALAPYINPGATAGTEVIGTNGANVPTSTPQGAIGLNNAIAAFNNLRSVSTTYTGTSPSTTAI